MATKKFIIEVEEGRTHCGYCPIGNAGNCSRFKFSSLGLDCDEFNLATMKIRTGGRKMIIDERIVREVIDTLHQANNTLLGCTGLDSSQEIAKKCKENETSINRRINNVISLLNSVKEKNNDTSRME